MLPALISVLLTLWATVAVAESQAGKRVALIIGNASYASFGKLDNPSNDAEDIASVLRQVGFTVIEGRDLTKRDMDRRLAQFSRAASDADTAVVYYAGHGLQYQRQNFLVPTDAQLKDGFDIPFETISVDSVIGALDSARGARIMILDACRNLPLSEGVKRSSGTGLARVAGRQGLIIAYATQSNEVAYDGAGRNSPYAEALAKALSETGLEVGQVFQRVALSVKKATQGKQLPEFSRSYPDEVFLNLGETDAQAWTRLRNSNVVADLGAFVEKYPTSFLSDAARSRIQLLENQARFAEQEAENRKQEERRVQERLLWARREEEQHKREQARLDDEKARREDEQRQVEQIRIAAQRDEEEARRREARERQQQARAEADEAARLAVLDILRREEAARQAQARVEADRIAALAAADQVRRNKEEAEAARKEQAHLDAVEAARIAAAEKLRKQEAARIEQVRRDGEKAALLAAAEAQRKEEAARKEQARLEAAEAVRIAAAEKLRKQEAARIEQARQDAEKAALIAAAEAQRKEEAARKEQARLDAVEAARVAAADKLRKQEAARMEQARQDAEKVALIAAAEAQRKEQARLEAAEAVRIAAAEKLRKQEAARIEQARQDAEKAALIAAAETQRKEEAARKEQARLEAAEAVRIAAADKLRIYEAAEVEKARAAAAQIAQDKEAREVASRRGTEGSTSGFALTADAPQNNRPLPEKLASASSPTAHVAYASLDLKAPVDSSSPTDVPRAVQRRLSELGCFTEPMETVWGRRSEAALEVFYKSAQQVEAAKVETSGRGMDRSIRVASTLPDQAVLDTLNSYSGRICPVVCPAGTQQTGEICVTVTCPSGAVLSNGVCLPQPVPVQSEAPGRIRKAARPVEPAASPKPRTARLPEARPEPAARRPESVRPATAAKAPVLKPSVKIVQPLRASPRVPALSNRIPAAPARATAASAPSVSPIEVGAARAMSRMP
ncbi:caspase family protein [Methylobacterium sp. Leaf93]|uniref:caspase family protein n=1 Tax=Methylobacterium sp. Leaf93 TaxID=1736249 RepID=UPI001FCD3A27|nr:caspase family protein [Methylobacterium sp. Leaf93]